MVPLKWEYSYKYISATTDSTPCHFPGIDGRVVKLQLLKGWKFMHCQFRTGSDCEGFIGCVCQNDVRISNIVTCLFVILYFTVHFAVYCSCMSKYQVIFMNSMSFKM